MRNIGKIGKRNIKANKILKELFYEKDITRCEKCGTDFALSFAHLHKRDWYKPKDKQHLLYAFEQVLLLCINCHEEIEVNKEKTEELFNQLRP